MQNLTSKEANVLLNDLFLKHYIRSQFRPYVKKSLIPSEQEKKEYDILYPEVKSSQDLDGIIAFIEIRRLPPEDVKLFTEYRGLKLFYFQQRNRNE